MQQKKCTRITRISCEENNIFMTIRFCFNILYACKLMTDLVFVVSVLLGMLLHENGPGKWQFDDDGFSGFPRNKFIRVYFVTQVKDGKLSSEGARAVAQRKYGNDEEKLKKADELFTKCVGVGEFPSHICHHLHSTARLIDILRLFSLYFQSRADRPPRNAITEQPSENASSARTTT